MTQGVELITVDAANVEGHGFFCYKSKPKSEGFHNKLQWLKKRIDEGMVIKMVYEDGRSVGFIEYIPAENAWRVVEAPGYIAIHCLWVVGRAKEKGYGSRLVNECVDDAKRMGKQGVVMVSSKGNWLANERIFLRNGFESIEIVTPGFNLLVKRFNDGPSPYFPQDLGTRSSRYGAGMTILYSDQCPYVPDAVQYAREVFEERGISTQTVKLESSEQLKAESPSAYGVFGIVYNGSLFSYHYLGKKEIRRLDEELHA